MKTVICILLWLNVSGQDSPFVATWKTNNEIGVVNYEVQSSINKVNWSLVTSVPAKRKDSNLYEIVLPRNPIYFRISSMMEGNTTFTTGAILLDTLFNISSISVKNRQVSFQSDNELNLKYYSILQSQNGNSFSEFQRMLPKGNSLYTSNRFANKQKYLRITVFFLNGSSKILDTRRI